MRIPMRPTMIGKALTVLASFSLFSLSSKGQEGDRPGEAPPAKKPRVFLEAALVLVAEGSTLDSLLEVLSGKTGKPGNQFLFAASLTFPMVDFEDHDRKIPAASVPTPAPSAPNGGLLWHRSRGKMPALIRLFKADRDSQILATPFILADDGDENTIEITETRYVSHGPDSTPSTPDSSEDAGIILGVTPAIRESGNVSIELDLEVSEFDEPQPGDASAPPPKISTALDCSVTIPGEQVVLIGGLTRDVKRKSIHKVPVLGHIPLLGRLFRSEETIVVSNKLYVFLQAHILEEGLEDGIDLFRSAVETTRPPAPSTTSSGSSR